LEDLIIAEKKIGADIPFLFAKGKALDHHTAEKYNSVVDHYNEFKNDKLLKKLDDSG